MSRYGYGRYFPYEYGGYGSPHFGAADAEVVLTIPKSQYGGPYAPGPYAPYGVGQAHPSQPQTWASPAKQHFFSLPPAQQEIVKSANLAINKAVKDLLAQGVAPRWILQMTNRFVATEHGGGAEPPIYTAWDAQAPSSVPPDLDHVWNGIAWVQPHTSGYWPR